MKNKLTAVDIAKNLIEDWEGDEEIFTTALTPAKERLKCLVTEEFFNNIEEYENTETENNTSIEYKRGLAYLICYYVYFSASRYEDDILILAEFDVSLRCRDDNQRIHLEQEKCIRNAKRVLDKHLKPHHILKGDNYEN